MTTPRTPDDVLRFWREAGPERWFKKDDGFDGAIRERFATTLEAAGRGELDRWAETPAGALALILVLDQFSRNLHRESARAFANDAKALELCAKVRREGWVDALLADGETESIAIFALMPLMHSEAIGDQEAGVAAMLRPEWSVNFDFAVLHRDIILRFGRFPHRNSVLGRHTSAAEREYLANGGFGG